MTKALAAFLAIFLLAAACSDDSNPDATTVAGPAPSHVPSPAPSPAAQPTLKTELVPFAWAPSPLILDIAGAVERYDPMGPFWAELKAERDRAGRSVNDSIRDFQVHVVDPTGTSRLLYRSLRWLGQLRWSDARTIEAEMNSYKAVPSDALDQTLSLEWGGTVSLDPQIGAATEAFDAYPGGRESGFMRSAHPYALSIKEDTGHIVLNLPGDGPSLRSYVPVVQEPNGLTRRLAIPVGASSPAQLSPDGSTLIFTGEHRSFRYNQTAGGGASLGNTWDTFFMPLDGTEAIKIPAAAVAMQLEGDSAGNADHRIVFASVIEEAQGPAPYLWTYDTMTKSLSLVTKLQGFAFLGPQWRPGTDTVEFAGDVNSGRILVDLGTRAITPKPPEPPYRVVSPDGRLAIRTVEPDLNRPPSGKDCDGEPYRVELLDLQAVTTAVLFECDDGYLSSAHWVNNDQFVLFVSSYKAGKGGGPKAVYKAELVNALTQEVIPLVPQREGFGLPYASPSGDRFVMTGDRLLLFDTKGALLHDYGPPPEGYRYSEIAWSQDGEQFAYLLTPRAADWIP